MSPLCGFNQEVNASFYHIVAAMLLFETCTSVAHLPYYRRGFYFKCNLKSTLKINSNAVISKPTTEESKN
jgi:hypothetical protein